MTAPRGVPPRRISATGRPPARSSTDLVGSILAIPPSITHSPSADAPWGPRSARNDDAGSLAVPAARTGLLAEQVLACLLGGGAGHVLDEAHETRNRVARQAIDQELRQHLLGEY